MRVVVRRPYVGRHPAPVGDVVAVRARPVPDLPGAGSVRRGSCGASPPARGRTHLAAVADVAGERVAQLRRVLLVQVDLVGRAVETEGDGLRRLTPVDIVDENNVDLLGHFLDLTVGIGIGLFPMLPQDEYFSHFGVGTITYCG